MGTPTLNFLPGVNAPAVIKGGAAYKAGVQPGDLILGINGEALTPSPKAVQRVVDVIRDNPGREVQLTIQRGGLDTKPFPLAVTPDLAAKDNGGVIGVKLGAHAKVGLHHACLSTTYLHATQLSLNCFAPPCRQLMGLALIVVVGGLYKAGSSRARIVTSAAGHARIRKGPNRCSPTRRLRIWTPA